MTMATMDRRLVSSLNGVTAQILLVTCLISWTIPNVAGRSVIQTNNGDGVTPPPPMTTPTTTATSSPSNPEIVILDPAGLPEYVWAVNASSPSINFTISRNTDNNHKIAVHLRGDCDFEGTIKLEWPKGGVKSWKCSRGDSTIFSSLEDRSFLGKRSNGYMFVTVPEVQDGLTEVLITPMLKESSTRESIKAVLIINIYKDVHGRGGCGKEYFDCKQSICPNKCCSEQGSAIGGSSRPHRSDFTFNFWEGGGEEGKSISSGGFFRCIPRNLTCNGHPNCGMRENIDETNEICNEERYCPCQTVCLTWNYVLTSLAIAILFIITPTAIVFALFHRRNVALERARLLRLAQARMAELRSEFTREAHLNDLPPTYDEVYDIKSPPPCFCQAVAIEMGIDAAELEGCGRNCNVSANRENEAGSTGNPNGTTVTSNTTATPDTDSQQAEEVNNDRIEAIKTEESPPPPLNQGTLNSDENTRRNDNEPERY